MPLDQIGSNLGTSRSQSSCCTSSHEVSTTFEKLFATQSKARTLQLCFQRQSIKKGSMSVNDYILKMKAIAENLSAARQLVSDEELILYILGGVRTSTIKATTTNLVELQTIITVVEAVVKVPVETLIDQPVNCVEDKVVLPFVAIIDSTNEKLVVGNGQLLHISHIGRSSINSDADFKPLFMNHVLHVLKITKNLLSISQFTKDNNVIAARET
ncbi:hypothetical protein CK203_050460 [Vitis vinifera]|uniref:Retrovirus-related Pol polyprotein from transposon TNT 1-94-like beta-barrel domain-containing protein n=1 Tax=Vitis vinifera TaxID=29760 RepID=A0A438H1J8_VITVI|nr:hypothetical protein CK203_050460 [Vitis vinifera]